MAEHIKKPKSKSKSESEDNEFDDVPLVVAAAGAPLATKEPVPDVGYSQDDEEGFSAKLSAPPVRDDLPPPGWSPPKDDEDE